MVVPATPVRSVRTDADESADPRYECLRGLSIDASWYRRLSCVFDASMPLRKLVSHYSFSLVRVSTRGGIGDSRMCSTY
jgi:hypothetical protein